MLQAIRELDDQVCQVTQVSLDLQALQGIRDLRDYQVDLVDPGLLALPVCVVIQVIYSFVP